MTYIWKNCKFIYEIRKVITIMKNIFLKVLKFIKFRIYEILYIGLLGLLSVYVVIHWEECIAMTFFDQFDGNNILFLVWIVLIILLFYDVEAKGWKFRKKRAEDTLREYNNAEITYVQKMNDIRDDIYVHGLNANETDGGNANNE